MKLLPFVLLLWSSVYANAQAFDPEARQMTRVEIASLLTDELRTQHAIRYEVYRAYRYDDESGEYFLVLTEKTPMNVGEEVNNDSIQAFMLHKVYGKISLAWKARDFVGNNDVSKEHSIWFWTKYYEFEDYDADGFVDPILVYGTSGDNGTDDGRIKILVYYMGEKSGVRHQNGTLDFQRRTTVDKTFYELPEEVRARVREIMKKITEDGNGIFPGGWEEAMAKGQLTLSEDN